MALEPYTGQRRRRPLLTYDMEWYPESYEHRLTGVFDGQRYRSYTSVRDFLNAELVPKNKYRIFFAHAGGLADIQFVLEAIVSRKNAGVRVDAAFSGSSAILVWITIGSTKYLLADSYWLLRDSLRKIGQSLGFEKTGDDYFCASYPHCGHPDKETGPTCIFWAPLPVLRDYNRRDCEVLYRGIERFQDELLELGGYLKPTIASSALMLFRARFLRQTIPTNEALNVYARQAYVASRVEVLAKRCGPAAYYDVNSSFPYSMTMPQPGLLRGTVSASSFSEKTLGLVHARVSVPPQPIPPLPVRVQGRVFFPTGSFDRWFDSADLLLLLESGGTIDRIREVVDFEPFTDLAAYVETIYELRRTEKDPFRRLVYKYLMNALYGKFGEGEEKESLVLHPSIVPPCPNSCEPGTCQCVRQLFPGAFLVKKFMPAAHAHVPISAHITALSRALITRALWQSDRPSYTDTDSLVTSSDLPVSDELGSLKREKLVSSGEFLAPKLYRLTHAADCDCGCEGVKVEVRAKGFPRLKSHQFDRLRDGDPVEVERMVRIRELYRSGETRPRTARDAVDPTRRLHKRAHSMLCPCAECLRHPPISKRAWEGDWTRAWTIAELNRYFEKRGMA